jgi:hypothetical protein
MKSIKKFSSFREDPLKSIKKSSLMKGTSDQDIANSCKGNRVNEYALNFINQFTFGIYPPAPEVDTSVLDELQAANDKLKDSFNDCKHQLTNCKVDQIQELMSQQLELSNALQSLTDNAQDMTIQKNYSLSVFTMGVVGLILVYIMASPTYRPPEKVF